MIGNEADGYPNRAEAERKHFGLGLSSSILQNADMVMEKGCWAWLSGMPLRY